MAVNVSTIILAKQAEATQTEQYRANGMRTIIDKFTGTNTTASAATLSVNLVAPGGSASDANLVVKAKSLAAGETYTFPELVGHVLTPGAFISTLAGTASAITIRASGREVT